MKLYQKLLTIVATLVIALVVIPTVSKPAEAWSCPAYSLCLFENANFGGAQYNDYQPTYCSNLPSNWNDRASSLVNNTPYTMVVYENANCTGGSFATSSGDGWTTAWPNWGWNDKITSYKRFGF